MVAAHTLPFRPLAPLPAWLRRAVALLVAVSLLLLPLPGTSGVKGAGGDRHAAHSPVPQVVMDQVTHRSGPHTMHHMGHAEGAAAATSMVHSSALASAQAVDCGGTCDDGGCDSGCGLCHLLIAALPQIPYFAVLTARLAGVALPLPVRHPERLEEPPRS